MRDRIGVWKKHSHEDTLKFMKAYAQHLKSETSKNDIFGFEDRINIAEQLEDPMEMRDELSKIAKEINE
jgi:hypothetical protein